MRDPAALEAVVARQQAVIDGLRTTSGEEADRSRAIALWKMGDALFRLRRMTDAVARLEEAERTFARVPDSALPTAAARLIRAGALIALERYEEGAELASEVQTYGASAQNSALLRAGSFSAAVAFKGVGRWQDAAAAATAYLKAVAADPLAEELPRVGTALVIWAVMERLSDRPEKALGLLERAIPLLAAGKDREQLCQAMDERAAALYSAGRPREARAAYDDIIAEFRDAPDGLGAKAVWTARAWKLRIWMRPHRPPGTPS